MTAFDPQRYTGKRAPWKKGDYTDELVFDSFSDWESEKEQFNDNKLRVFEVHKSKAADNFERGAVGVRIGVFTAKPIDFDEFSEVNVFDNVYDMIHWISQTYDFLGDVDDYYAVDTYDGCIETERHEYPLGEEPSAEDKERWKKGEIDLWFCMYSIYFKVGDHRPDYYEMQDMLSGFVRMPWKKKNEPEFVFGAGTDTKTG